MSIHYASGSSRPEKKGDQIRVYSAKICPYVQRARLVLSHKNIPHEVININLDQKPDWFLEKNPAGKVPFLEHGDKTLDESGIIMDYLDEAFPEIPLHPKDPYKKACQKIIMEKYGKVITSYFKFWFRRDVEEAKVAIVKDLKEFEDTLKDPFFGGSEPSMLDFYMYPHIERFPIFKDRHNFDVLQAGSFPKLLSWVARMSETAAVKATCNTVEYMTKFYQSSEAGKPQYDF